MQLKRLGRKYKEQWEAVQKELDQTKAATAGQQSQKTAAAEQANKALTEKLTAAEKEKDEAQLKVTEKDTELTTIKEQMTKVQQVTLHCALQLLN